MTIPTVYSSNGEYFRYAGLIGWHHRSNLLFFFMKNIILNFIVLKELDYKCSALRFDTLFMIILLIIKKPLSH